MTSIVIAAHNEATVIGRCLDAVLDGAVPGEFDVIVVANGCVDATAQVAAQRDGVRVIELPVAGKVAALNVGDAAAIGYPRIYLDADIVLPADGIRALRRALSVPETDRAAEILATTARRVVDVSRSSLLVCGYYAISSRLPAFQNALFGRGVIVLSAAGRARFDQFPDVIADDLFLDSLFSGAEKREVTTVSARIAAPRTTRDLLRRLARVRRGNASLRAIRPDGEGNGSAVRRSDRVSWLRDVVIRDPVLIPAAACYVVLTLLAVFLARLSRRTVAWGRDDSSRTENPPGPVPPLSSV